MEAKDTVMNEQEILEACVGASIPPSLDYETELLVAQTQAKISFKAGIDVLWKTLQKLGHQRALDDVVLAGKLKDWGIE